VLLTRASNLAETYTLAYFVMVQPESTKVLHFSRAYNMCLMLSETYAQVYYLTVQLEPTKVLHFSYSYSLCQTILDLLVSDTLACSKKGNNTRIKVLLHQLLAFV
jgi:hypothetical protein